ncbi:hypothetical protein [uncultured Metabacillus sp.]|uniref:hypothetical protein n=1 Tax=uncultured Metabacillus sp. TaxID=2860135 RepID=UPI00262E28A0|nr:hypothetical protein [uncultured Metabacillus sp.]
MEYFLENWERDYYEGKLIKEYPEKANSIKDLNDVALMNIYDSDNWGEYIKEL